MVHGDPELGVSHPLRPTALKQWDILLAMIEPSSIVSEASSATYCEDALREKAMLDGDVYRDAPGKEKAAFASYGKSVAGGLSLAAEELLDAGDAVKKPRDELKKNSQNEEGRWIEVEVSTPSYIVAKLPPGGPLHPLFHESVRTRKLDPFLRYSPRAQYAEGTEA
ncbi:hypothetical protein BJV78DRAFT_1214689, partial [Lactifluus subvellereus]